LKSGEDKVSVNKRQFPKRLKAVLFDYDGVLVDSMYDNFRAWRKVFLKQKVSLRKNDYLPLEGMNPAGVARTIVLNNKLKLSESQILKIARDKDNVYVNFNKLRLYPGVLQILKRLKASKKLLALVSGATKLRLAKTAPGKLLALFDVLITGDMNLKVKPSPDPYKRALEMLEVESHEAVAVENAPLGILSVSGAGLYCIAIRSTLPAKFLSNADLIIEKFFDLKKYLLQGK